MSFEKPYLPNNPELKHEVLLERIRELQESIQGQQAKYLAGRWRLDPKKIHQYLFNGDRGATWELVERLSRTEDGSGTLTPYYSDPILFKYRRTANAEQDEIHGHIMGEAQELLDSHIFNILLNEARVSFLTNVHSEGVAPAVRRRMGELVEGIGRRFLELGEPIPDTLHPYLADDFALRASIHAAEEGAALDQGWERLAKKIEEIDTESPEASEKRSQVFQDYQEKLLRSQSEEVQILNQMAKDPLGLFDALYKPKEALRAIIVSN